MKPFLLDVNVLIALTWPSHIDHTKAHNWFYESQNEGWATTPITQCGFVRISSNPKIIRDAVTPGEALSALNRIVKHPNHRFWPDRLSLAEDAAKIFSKVTGHRQVTDAYLLALSIANGGRLATMDKSIPTLLSGGSPYENQVYVIS